MRAGRRAAVPAVRHRGVVTDQLEVARGQAHRDGHPPCPCPLSPLASPSRPRSGPLPRCQSPPPHGTRACCISWPKSSLRACPRGHGPGLCLFFLDARCIVLGWMRGGAGGRGLGGEAGGGLVWGQHPDRPPPRWNITFVLDRRSMFSVTSVLPDKRTREHEVRHPPARPAPYIHACIHTYGSAPSRPGERACEHAREIQKRNEGRGVGRGGCGCRGFKSTPLRSPRGNRARAAGVVCGGNRRANEVIVQ
jgi:hypothetical protein